MWKLVNRIGEELFNYLRFVQRSPHILHIFLVMLTVNRSLVRTGPEGWRDLLGESIEAVCFLCVWKGHSHA